MYKRALAALLSVLIMITACSHETEIDDAEELPVDGGAAVEEPIVDTVALKPVWRETNGYKSAELPFAPTKYTVKAPAFQVEPQLSNIANINRFNGLSKVQREMLIKNGFVVLEPNPEKAYIYKDMHVIYEDNEYLKLPSFITVDTALHIYHKFFGETLKRIEGTKLVEALQSLTSNMLQKSLLLYQQPENQSIAEELKEAVVYFSVANKLINDSYGNTPKELQSIAEKEVEAINLAEGMGHSPLFKLDLNYGQFVVRGHYAGDEKLEKYFKTMMWYGLTGAPFKNRDESWDYDSIKRSLLITYMSYLQLRDRDDIELWDKIYAPTNLFVGSSDDINILQLKEVILKVYGEEVQAADFAKEEYYQELTAELEKLPGPQIVHRTSSNIALGKQFRFMGQRYTLDGNILQDLMYPMLRPMPTALDVAAAFGSTRAEELVMEDYLEYLEASRYTKDLQKMKDMVNAVAEEEWRSNLYNGWLWVLRSVWRPQQNVGLPMFMQQQAWEDKSLQAGLGSYSELKHDTILYAKQPMAEMGGGEEPKEIYLCYVEPAVEVYDRLLWLVQYSKESLEERGLLDDNGAIALNAIEKLYRLLIDCSVKQLRGETITEEENQALRYIGGTMEYITLQLSTDYSLAMASAVVADVASSPDGFLEIATGLTNEIYVAVYNEDKVYLARGAVYSFYEFESEKAMTDEEWHKRLGIEKLDFDGWIYYQLEPELMKNPPLQPEWIGTFKAMDQNQVNISEIEYSIEN